MHRSPFGCACALLVASVAFPGAARAAWSTDPTVNVPVCTAIGDQLPLVACTDGAGGMFIAWSDQRSGAHDLYATHLSAQGTVVAGWPVNGLAVCTASGDQTNPALVYDGSGGALVIWQDGRSVGAADIYAQHLTSAGTVSPGWPSLASNGLLLAGAPNKQFFPVAVSDGAGGALVAWQDLRNGVDENIYAQHVLAGGVIAPGWSPNGDSLCVASGDQTTPTIASDGAGGAIVAWNDHRGADLDIYAQHINGAGAIVAGWPGAIAGGLAISTQAMDDGPVTIAADGFGGAYLAWFGTASNTYRAQRVAGNGNVLGWPSAASGGLALGVTANLIQAPVVVADGAGGAIIAGAGVFSTASFAVHVGAGGDAAVDWTNSVSSPGAQIETESYGVSDGFGGAFVVANFGLTPIQESLDLYATHYTSAGALATGWASGGTPLSTAPGLQALAALVPDGQGGVLAAWADARDSAATGVDLYAQRIERFGHLGEPAPQIVSVLDVPNDQGGAVRVNWNASYLDAYPGFGVSSYQVWRQVPAAAAQAALRRGARLWRGDGAPPTGPAPVLRVSQESAQTFYWQPVASQPAFGLPGYSYVAATASDSVAASNPRTAFEVQAINGDEFWFSAPDSGYSVDNLPPAVPAAFAGTFVSGSGAFLNWNNNSEADLAGYHLYRGATPGFAPAPGDRIATLTSPGYTDAGAPPAYYKLSAFDIHGNESGFASLLPQGTAAVGPGAGPAFALAEPRPNPSRVGAFALSFTLPTADPATLEVVDLGGRAWMTREVGALGAGTHELDLAAARLAPGMYFVRLTQGGRRMVRRVVVLE